MKRGEREHAGGERVAVGRLAEQRDHDHRHRQDAQQGEDVGHVEREHRRPVSRHRASSAGVIVRPGAGELRARANTASSIGSVSLPVKVFCCDGW